LYNFEEIGGRLEPDGGMPRRTNKHKQLPPSSINEVHACTAPTMANFVQTSGSSESAAKLKYSCTDAMYSGLTSGLLRILR